MPLFEFEIIDREGKVKQGRMEAVQEELLRQDLTQQGLFVIDVRRSAGGAGAVRFTGRQENRPIGMASAEMVKRLIYRVRLADVVLFSSQLAAMIEGGLHAPSFQLLQYEQGEKKGQLAIRFAAYDPEGELERRPLIVNEREISRLRAEIARSPRLKALLRRLVEE